MTDLIIAQLQCIYRILTKQIRVVRTRLRCASNAFACAQKSPACISALVLTTAMMVPNTQDLIHDVIISHDVIARHAESKMTLAETP